MAPRVVLIGPPGAGKSSTGQALAELWETTLHDTDAAIEESAGKSISDIFIEDGEPAFRRLEEAAVAQALATQTGVVALGGGAIMSEATQELLAGHAVVFLDVTIADAAKRIGLDQSRPLLAVNPRASWNALMAVRRPVYTRLAQVTINTNGQTADEVAEQISEALG